MYRMSIPKKMNIRKSTKELALDVDKPLKLIIGNRDATLFSKSFDYTKLLDNNYKDYIDAEEQKRLLRDGFIKSFNVSTNPTNLPPTPTSYLSMHTPRGVSHANIFGDTVNDIEMEQAKDDAARENLDENLQERQQQAEARRQQLLQQMSDSLRATDNLLFGITGSYSLRDSGRSASSMSGIEEEQPSQPSQQAQTSEDTENSKGVKEIIKTFEDKKAKAGSSIPVKQEIDKSVKSVKFKEEKKK